MNAAHDIKILEYWICICSLAEGVFKRKKKHFGKKTTKKQKQNKT